MRKYGGVNPDSAFDARKMVMRKYGGVNPDSAFDVEKDGNEEVCGAELDCVLISVIRCWPGPRPGPAESAHNQT